MAKSTGNPTENSPNRCPVLSMMYQVQLEHQFTIPVEWETKPQDYDAKPHSYNQTKVTKLRCVCGEEQI